MTHCGITWERGREREENKLRNKPDDTGWYSSVA